jgi:hypothetical protein
MKNSTADNNQAVSMIASDDTRERLVWLQHATTHATIHATTHAATTVENSPL